MMNRYEYCTSLLVDGVEVDDKFVWWEEFYKSDILKS